jgi:3-deoxy-7-phosphoheptulonate synthase
VGIIPSAKRLTHLPIIVDPSHAAGKRDNVVPLARAGVAAGADGLIVEVLCDPDRALSDGAQSLYPAQFDAMMQNMRGIASLVGRTMVAPRTVRSGVTR